MKTYSKTITVEGKRLDELVQEEYNSLELFEKILEINPAIHKSVFVPQGVVLIFVENEVQSETVKKVEAKELW